MKKLTAIILCALMLVAMAIPAFAEPQAKAEGYVENPAFEVKKATAAWNADGVYTAGEYYDIDVQKTWITGAWADESLQDACLNLDFTLAMSWDESYIYTYVSFVDPDGSLDNTCDADPASMWQQGALQINLGEVDGVGEERLEYGIGKSSDTGDLLSTVWADYLASGYAVTGDFTVVTDGAKITYEARTPISAFSAVAAATGAQYGYCLVIAWGEGTNHKHTQLAWGCTGWGKDASAFAHITLADAPIVYTYPGSAAPASGSILFASVIGNETGWGDNAAAGAAAAVDGNPTTFFDPLGVGDGFCGVDAGDTYILTEAHILPRIDNAPRYEGAMIQGSNDMENWTTLYTSPAAAAAVEWQIITEFENNTGYRYYRYFNETQHGDVAEIEFYGVTPSGEAAPAAEAAPVAAAQTADFAAVAALVAVISLAGVALTKKR